MTSGEQRKGVGVGYVCVCVYLYVWFTKLHIITTQPIPVIRFFFNVARKDPPPCGESVMCIFYAWMSSIYDETDRFGGDFKLRTIPAG